MKRLSTQELIEKLSDALKCAEKLDKAEVRRKCRRVELSTFDGIDYRSEDYMGCSECERELKPQDRFCPGCGAEIERKVQG